MRCWNLKLEIEMGTGMGKTGKTHATFIEIWE